MPGCIGNDKVDFALFDVDVHDVADLFNGEFGLVLGNKGNSPQLDHAGAMTDDKRILVNGGLAGQVRNH